METEDLKLDNPPGNKSTAKDNQPNKERTLAGYVYPLPRG